MAFHDQLAALLAAQQCGDGLAFVRQLYALSSRLHRPCLRLRLLQQVLGLDTRFSRDIVHGVVCLAFDVVEEMSAARRQPAPSVRAQAASDSGGPRLASTPRAVSTELTLSPMQIEGGCGPLEALDGFDEATRLEAESLLGSPRRESDPLGEESRRRRVSYYYR